MIKKGKTFSGGADLSVGSLALGGIFKGLGNLIDQVSKLENLEGVRNFGENGEPGKEAKGVFGFTVKTGLSGTPTIERFGNMREGETGPVFEQVREPIIDVIEEKATVTVIIELPGVDNSDIKLAVRDDILEIKADSSQQSFGKEVLLPYVVDAAGLKRSYKNGVLKVVLAKNKSKGAD